VTAPNFLKKRTLDLDGFSLRRATRQDAEAIARVLDASFAGYQAQYCAEAFRATVLEGAEIIARLEEGPTWVALCHEGVIGTVSAVTTSDGLYVRSMAVGPDVQGRGVGRALLYTVEAFAKQIELTRMYLSTTPFLFAAIALYERFGFRRSAAGPFDLFGTPLFTMSKDLEIGDCP
jgi:putative acetyltransferase